MQKSKGWSPIGVVGFFPRHNAGTARRVTLPPSATTSPCAAESAPNNGVSLYRMAHFAEIILSRDLEFQRNSQTRISMPDTPTAETAVTIAQIMSLIIRPYYPRDGRPAVQNCTEHMEGSHALLVTTHHLAVDQAGPHLEVVHRLDH